MGNLLNLSSTGLLRYYKYPDSITINGDLLQYETNTAQNQSAYVYTLTYGTYNAPIKSVLWDVIAPNGIATIDSQTNTQCGLRINTVTSEYVKVTITVTVTFATNKQMSADIVVGVQLPGYPVDLGLPSGLLWRNTYLGAATPKDAGDYFMYGEMEGYTNSTARNTAMNENYPELVAQDGEFTGGFDQRSYTATGGSAVKISIGTSLPLDKDVANSKLGGSWRMPNYADSYEVINNNCVLSNGKLKGVNGTFLTGPNGNKIFFKPMGGATGTTIYWSGQIRLMTSYWSNSGSHYISAFTLSHIVNSAKVSAGYPIRPVMNPSE